MRWRMPDTDKQRRSQAYIDEYLRWLRHPEQYQTQLDALVLALRAQHWTWQMIGDAMMVTREGARQRYLRAQRRRESPPTLAPPSDSILA